MTQWNFIDGDGVLLPRAAPLALSAERPYRIDLLPGLRTR